jgi:hypothetical protein
MRVGPSMAITPPPSVEQMYRSARENANHRRSTSSCPHTTDQSPTPKRVQAEAMCWESCDQSCGCWNPGRIWSPPKTTCAVWGLVNVRRKSGASTSTCSTVKPAMPNAPFADGLVTRA